MPLSTPLALRFSRPSGSRAWAAEDRLDPPHAPQQLRRPPVAGHKCVKKLWYDCAGFAQQAEEHIDVRLQRIFDIGHAWHHTIQRYGNAGAWGPKEFYHDEVEIDPDKLATDGQFVLPVAGNYWIRGSVDAIIDRYVIPNVPTLGDVTVRMVHEYKTINSNGYSNLKKPKPEHKWQAMIYSAVFNVPLVVFLYFNKDSGAQIDYPIPFDPILWKQIEYKLETVKYYIENDQLPPWEITSAVKDPAECKECGYFKICQPDRR
jgi:CRISPR/Cas system-associated exonuclease Cas4 (RecB family)